jgi:hypothetical protein
VHHKFINLHLLRSPLAFILPFACKTPIVQGQGSCPAIHGDAVHHNTRKLKSVPITASEFMRKSPTYSCHPCRQASHAFCYNPQTTTKKKNSEEKKGEKNPKQSSVLPVYARHVDSSPLGFSLSSHRHSYIGLVFSSRFID